MKLQYRIRITSVDNQTSFLYEGTKAKECQDFLNRYDHEGSSINVEIEITDPEDGYEFLDMMRDKETEVIS